VNMPKRILSYACLATGMIGLIVPFLPGIPLLILGFRLLEPDDWIRRALSSWRVIRASSALRNSQ
jgi:uncharacterized protein YqgC (DUF456 family)